MPDFLSFATNSCGEEAAEHVAFYSMEYYTQKSMPFCLLSYHGVGLSP